jgi:hypothetical protein
MPVLYGGIFHGQYIKIGQNQRFADTGFAPGKALIEPDPSLQTVPMR